MLFCICKYIITDAGNSGNNNTLAPDDSLGQNEPTLAMPSAVITSPSPTDLNTDKPSGKRNKDISDKRLLTRDLTIFLRLVKM